jgi:hypothetical protein
MSDSDAQEFVDAIDQKARNMGGLDSIETKIAKAGEELASDIDEIKLINKRNALFTIQAVRNLSKWAKSHASPFEGILGFLENSRRFAESAGRGIDAIKDGYVSKYLGELKSRLTQESVLDVFNKNLLAKEIYQEFYKPGSSGNKQAAAIRDIMTALKQDMVRLQNLYGSYIHFLPEHVKRQTYSPGLIKKNFGPERFKDYLNFNRHLTPEETDATFKAWAEFMLPLLDHEKTFKDSDPMEFLRGAFDGVMSGRHGPIQKASGAEINVLYFKAGALAKKASQQRLIHFLDGESAFKAYSVLSDEPISKGFVQELEHASANIALMQQLGPNPKGTLDEVVKQLEYDYSRQGDEKKLKDIQENKHRLYSALSFLDRSASIPENPTMATVTATTISLLSQAKLGKLLLFALPDRALMQSTLTRNGLRGLDALATAMTIKKPSTPEERLRLTMLGGELKSFIGAVHNRFTSGAEVGVHSSVMKAQRHFFNFTGINWLDDVGTDAVVGALSRHAGSLAHLPFEKLIPEFKQMMTMYGISPKEWDAWRSTAYTVDGAGKIKEGIHDGDVWITPDNFNKVPLEVIDSMLVDRELKPTDNNRQRQYALLEDKFRTWLTAQRDESVLVPGSKEHRLATFGTQAGTKLGSMTRLLMMFKTFPIAVWTKILRREIQGSGARTFKDWMINEKNTNFHTTQLIALSTIAGYLSLTIDEALTGKEPRSFTDRNGEINTDASLKILKDSFLRGNAATLMGDLLLKEYDTGYNDIVTKMGGPALGEAVKGVSLASKAIHGEFNPRDGVNFVKDNLPWANLFYVKPALDHLIWFNIAEMLEPGSLREAEMKRKEDYNQEYFLPPSGNN